MASVASFEISSVYRFITIFDVSASITKSIILLVWLTSLVHIGVVSLENFQS